MSVESTILILSTLSYPIVYILKVAKNMVLYVMFLPLLVVHKGTEKENKISEKYTEHLKQKTEELDKVLNKVDRDHSIVRSSYIDSLKTATDHVHRVSNLMVKRDFNNIK